MGAVQARIEPVKFLRENHHVSIIRFRYERKPFNLNKVPGLGQRDPRAIARVGAVGDEVLVFDLRHARIFDAEFFVGGKRSVRRWSEEWLGIHRETESVVTVRRPDNRSEERRVGKEGRSRWSPYH